MICKTINSYAKGIFRCIIIVESRCEMKMKNDRRTHYVKNKLGFI